MLVARIVSSDKLNTGKHGALSDIARRLGKYRAEIWRRYGGLAGVGRTYFSVRNEWMATGREFTVPARLWKETLNDVLADIATYRAAAKKKLHKPVLARTKALGLAKGWTEEQVKAERKRLFTALKADTWITDRYLRRMMRKHFKHGKTRIDTHIKLDSGCYAWFKARGRGWIEVMSLVRGKRIAIPLASNHPISGTIRLIVTGNAVDVHHTMEAPVGKPCGVATIGIDKGYTEAFVDSDGEHHGLGLGSILSAQTDRNNERYKARNKLRAIAEKSAPAKRARIELNNLGRMKIARQKQKHEGRVKTLCYEAAHSVVNKASVIAAEDLTAVIRSTGKRRIGSHGKRRLSGWVKGLLAEALETVSQRRGSALHLVNCAYTSQVHSRCGCLGIRTGDVLHCEVCGDVAYSDQEAAREVLARLTDHEIGRWTPFQTVKAILLERSSRYRLRLSNQDSSCVTVMSTESEKPDSSHGQLWARKRNSF